MWTSADTHLLKLFKELKSSATVVIAAENEVKNLFDSSSGPKRIDSSSSSRKHEAVLSAVLSATLPVHINASSAACVMLQCSVLSKFKLVSYVLLYE